jgi:hypothetical protein
MVQEYAVHANSCRSRFAFGKSKILWLPYFRDLNGNMTFNAWDFAGVAQFCLQPQSPDDFLALLNEHA